MVRAGEAGVQTESVALLKPAWALTQGRNPSHARSVVGDGQKREVAAA